MGGKYEIRWKLNRKCPFWGSEFTDDLNVAFAIACIKVIVASVIGGAIAELASWGVADIVDISNILGSFIALVITGAIGLAIIFALCRILGVSEVTSVVRRLARRLKR